ncbi:MAG: hypothetical protein JWN61_2094 [Pseudonocardiales bacterium]|nr:hypothetical protein [Pseudonocardiales bacterium]
MTAFRTSRAWIALAALLAAIVLVLSWFLLVGPERDDAAAVREQTATSQDSNTLLRARIATLAKQVEQLDQRKADLVAAQAQLPIESALAVLTRQVTAAGDRTLVSVTALQAGEPIDTRPAGAAPVAPSSTSAPVQASGTVYRLPITLTASGRADDLAAFLNELQTVEPRAVLITAVQITSGASIADAATAQISLSAYVAPAGA